MFFQNKIVKLFLILCTVMSCFFSILFAGIATWIMILFFEIILVIRTIYLSIYKNIFFSKKGKNDPAIVLNTLES